MGDFALSLGGFLSFLGRPFTNVVGIILLIGVAVWIWARVTGRIGGGGGRGESSGSGGVDYEIK